MTLPTIQRSTYPSTSPLPTVQRNPAPATNPAPLNHSLPTFAKAPAVSAPSTVVAPATHRSTSPPPYTPPTSTPPPDPPPPYSPPTASAPGTPPPPGYEAVPAGQFDPRDLTDFQLDELVHRIIGRITRLIRTELRLDRERIGKLRDPRH
ncbi:extensin [Streptomyces sp. NPDC091219]|uniref:extensin n=1 Tax=Streptomyces sp. NPDC091219 TaxID=3155193 RepID=UPI00344FA20F